MAKQKKKKRGTTITDDEFNFLKFDRLLEKLRRSGTNVLNESFDVQSLRTENTFKIYFDNYTIQEINTYLLFYRKQFE